VYAHTSVSDSYDLQTLGLSSNRPDVGHIVKFGSAEAVPGNAAIIRQQKISTPAPLQILQNLFLAATAFFILNIPILSLTLRECLIMLIISLFG